MNIKDRIKILKIEERTLEIDRFEKEKIDMFNNMTHIILLDDTLIGMMEYEISNDKIILYSIEIIKEYRNKGYGTIIINKLLSIKNIRSIVGEAIETALDFYLSFKNVDIDINEFEEAIYFKINKELSE